MKKTRLISCPQSKSTFTQIQNKYQQYYMGSSYPDSISVGSLMPYSSNLTLLDLIAEQVRRTPHHIAFRFEQDCLNYLELDCFANHLGHQLRDAGIKKGDPVALIFNNSLEYPVTLLALLKLGAIWVPLDKDWGAKRLNMALSHLAPKTVLTNLVSSENYPWRQVDLDQLNHVSEDPKTKLIPSDPIYGFFTSGSTGIPKCAINIHKGITNRFLDMSRRYGVSPGDSVLVNNKLAFDSTLWQLLWPLTVGSTSVIPRPWSVYDLDEVISLIDVNQITMTDFVPSMFNLLVDEIIRRPSRANRLSSLRQILIGGEEIDFKSVLVFKQKLPHVGIANTYGVTECSMGMVFYQIDDQLSEPLPIGRPIDNTFVVILDEQLRPVAHGEHGELYLGGNCLGAGYWQDSQKTSSVFIPSPFTDLPGDSLYRTGDFGYMNKDGLIYYLGRKDRQFQIGGNRVELGEIEAVLNRHKDVKQARVVFLEETHQNRMLAAAVLTSKKMTAKDLKFHISDNLPTYMHPRRFVFLSVWPLNANGKVDLAELKRMLASAKVNKSKGQKRSSSLLQKQLAILWQELLSIDTIELNSNFFDAGGDSILAMVLLAKIEEAFGKRLSFSELMQNPSFEDMCRLVNQSQESAEQEKNHLNQLTTMLNDLKLCDELSCVHVSEPKTVSSEYILLTGATGFIGIHLLADLLQHTRAKIFCLVRAKEPDNARQRILDSLCFYKLSMSSTQERIIPIVADLANPRLGLDYEQFETLANTIDTVFHCGAMVNFLYDYDHHRPANVLGTSELLSLTARGKLKRFYFISTLGVFPLRKISQEGRIATENCYPDPYQTPDGGYEQSKTIAELLVAKARSKGVAATIFRLGEIMPHTTTGVANPKALSHMLFKAFSMLGCFPVSDKHLDYTPVDYVTRAIVSIAQQPEWLGTNFHLCHPTGISINNFMGFISGQKTIMPISSAKFRIVLEKKLASESNGLLQVVSLLIEKIKAKSNKKNKIYLDYIDDLLMTTMESICQKKTKKALSSVSLNCPDLDTETLQSYKHLLSTN